MLHYVSFLSFAGLPNNRLYLVYVYMLNQHE